VTWTDYFTLVGVVPGRIVVPGHGTLDFSDGSLPVEKIRTLFENGFPYLKATSLGKDTFYPEPPLVEPEEDITRELASPAKKPPKMKT
jgi:hypothetical protein